MKITITHTTNADKTEKWTWRKTTVKGKTLESILERFHASNPYSTIISTQSDT